MQKKNQKCGSSHYSSYIHFWQPKMEVFFENTENAWPSRFFLVMLGPLTRSVQHSTGVLNPPDPTSMFFLYALCSGHEASTKYRSEKEVQLLASTEYLWYAMFFFRCKGGPFHYMFDCINR